MTKEYIPQAYIDIKDAAELTGYSAKHLRKLAKAGLLDNYKTKNSIMVSWYAVKRLAAQQKPFWVTLPDSALEMDTPDPRLLLHTSVDETDVQYLEDYFCDRV